MSVMDDIVDYLIFEDETSLDYPFAKRLGDVTDEDICLIEALCDGDGDTETIYKAAMKVLGKKKANITKEDLRLKLEAGMKLVDILQFESGQDCEIFKAGRFSDGDEVIYVPDVSLNEIPLDRPISDPEELESVLGYCYTGRDFLDECNGDREMAERLFWYCDWQHPSSAVDEIIDEGEEE